MSSDRIERMTALVAKFPDDPKGRYFLAHELFRAERWAEAADQYEAYLGLSPSDEGAGWKNYGSCLARLSRKEDARVAYRKGIESALMHHHEGLADEIRGLLEAIE